MDADSDNENWIIETGASIIQKKTRSGLDSLTPWELLVYCLWVADYGMRNAGDLGTAHDVYANFQSEARRLAEGLSLPLTGEMFSLAQQDLQRHYFERFDRICSEIRNAEPGRDRGAQSVGLTHAATPELEFRQLQGQVYISNPDTQKPTPTKVFYSTTNHTVVFRIGKPDPNWFNSNAPFPEDQLPQSKAGHQLTIAFFEPEFCPEPQLSTILLPPEGPSDCCKFQLYTKPGATHVEARVMVAYNNRILFSSILEGPIINNDRSFFANEHIRLQSEVVVNATYAHLESQPEYEASLLINHDKTGTPSAFKLCGGRLTMIAIDNLAGSINAIDDEIRKCDWGDPLFKTLRSPGTVSFLRMLARHGTLLFRAIVETQFDSRLARTTRLQVIAARPEARLPVEFFYSYPSPKDDAQLCPNAEVALQIGKCVSCLQNPQSAFVCPLGFWGLNRVIEWHVYRNPNTGGLTGADFAFQEHFLANRKRLSPFEKAVYGASQKADRVSPNAVANLAKALNDSATKVTVLNSWNDWKSCLTDFVPSLVVLLPHAELDDAQIMTLEISGIVRAVDQIGNSRFVNKIGSAPPIVFLLGCETGAPQISFYGAVSAFRYMGAAIVVSSFASILGRHASRIAIEFLSTLKQNQNNPTITFGDVVLAVRRKLFSDDCPVVLAVSAYGDADCLIN